MPSRSLFGEVQGVMFECPVPSVHHFKINVQLLSTWGDDGCGLQKPVTSVMQMYAHKLLCAGCLNSFAEYNMLIPKLPLGVSIPSLSHRYPCFQLRCHPCQCPLLVIKKVKRDIYWNASRTRAHVCVLTLQYKIWINEYGFTSILIWCCISNSLSCIAIHL